MFQVEAKRYLNENLATKFPWLGRENSIRFIDCLYEHNAISVEIVKVNNDKIIQEIIVRYNKNDTKKIIATCFKAKPSELIEINNVNSFRTVKLIWSI